MGMNNFKIAENVSVFWSEC